MLELADKRTGTADAEAFKNLLADTEEPDDVENKWHCFGHYFLDALKDM